MDFKILLSDESKQHIAMREKAVAEVSAIVKERGGKPMTWAEWNEQRGNSYFMEEMIKYLDDDALARHAEYCLTQTGALRKLAAYAPANTYDDALLCRIIPELVKRMKKG